jgi:hypothetical protein
VTEPQPEWNAWRMNGEEKAERVAAAYDPGHCVALACAWFQARTSAMPSDTLHVHIEDPDDNVIGWLGGD